MGALEQMGPSGDVRTQRHFWERVERTPLEGTHLRANERLCAVALIKRFCWASIFCQKAATRAHGSAVFRHGHHRG